MTFCQSSRCWLGIAACATLTAGCGRSESVSRPASGSPAAGNGSAFVLEVEPTGAADVIRARETVEDQDDVVVVGRIGGSENPWVDGRAAFSIVDVSLPACSDREGDDCPKPWDYCCETDRLPAARALVKFVDQEGNVLARDARELFGLQELQTVVVQGTAQRDEAGNLTVLARGLFVR